MCKKLCKFIIFFKKSKTNRIIYGIIVLRIEIWIVYLAIRKGTVHSL